MQTDQIKTGPAIASLTREAVAAAAIVLAMRDDLDGDDELRNDTIEGETGLMEAMDAAIARIAVLEAHREALDSQINKIAARRIRFEKQEKAIRSALLTALTECKIKKVERTQATLSRQATPRKVEPVDEDAIPAEFIITERRLNKTAILKALKEGRDVPGTRLSDAGETINIRMK